MKDYKYKKKKKKVTKEIRFLQASLSDYIPGLFQI